MKTSRSQQEQTRRQIVDSAVALMTAQGYDGTTMKDIAHAAGIGDATIYKYFPSKDRIVLGYFDQLAQSALADTLATPGLADYGLQEKLQRLTDAVLERLQPDRAFVVVVREVLQRSPLLMLGQPLPAREALRDTVVAFLSQAEDRLEIERCEFKTLAGHIYTDYLAGVIAWWLRDTSEGQADTTRLVDLSLDLLVLLLRTGVVNRALALGGFVLRSQLGRLLQGGPGLLDVLQAAHSTLGAGRGTAPPPPASPPPPAPPEPAPAPKPTRRRRTPPAA